MAINMSFPSDGEANNGWKLYIITLVMTVVAGLFVVARCATRIYKRSLGPDDYAIIAALLFSVFTAVAVLRAIENGYGKHIDDLTDQQVETALEWFFIAQTPYKVTVCLNKVSVLLLYRRIFVQQKYQTSVWVVLGIVVGWSIGTSFATIFQCLPVEASWSKSLDGDCIDKSAFWIAYAVGNILTDVLVLGLPIPPVINLNMPWRQRLLLCGVFLLGGFVTITSILRTTAVSNSLKNKQDITYNFITRGIWTLVEANTGIICACLPILKQPIAWLLPRFFRDSRKGYSYNVGTPGYGGSNQLNPLSNRWRRTQEPTTGSGKRLNNFHVSAGSVEPVRNSDEEGIVMEAQGFASRESGEAQSDGSGTLRTHKP